MLKHRLSLLAAVVVVAAMAGLAHGSSANAYVGTWSGYAFGSLNGCCGQGVYQGTYAAHYYNACPGDPAAAWPLWTVIGAQTPGEVDMVDRYGNFLALSQFSNTDTGDFSCSRGNYWADIYFGR